MIGIALSGGGARGISHLGVLKALNEANIYPDIISGTSAGAIIGALYSAGHSPDDCLKIVKETNVLSVFSPSFSWKGLLRIDKLGKILKDYLPTTFEELKIPMTVAATDINEGVIKYFSDGPLIPTILASSCIPVIFKPVIIEGASYVDGGILNNLPAEAIRSKVDSIIGISCNPNGKVSGLSNAKVLMERSALLAINGNTMKSRAICDAFIEPQNLVRFSGFNLSQAQDIFDEGYNYATENMTTFALEKLIDK